MIKESDQRLREAIVQILYKDEDGDLVQLNEDEEFQDALEFAEMEEMSVLQFFVIEKGYEPILEIPDAEEGNKDTFESLNTEVSQTFEEKEPVTRVRCNSTNIYENSIE